ncbi:cyclic nucleotide-binding protein [Polaribacter reichenbachii]|uniref:Cyclic nucleotide-binding protein n=1 Tax=Polaribacter reichenbachii TaxID=996801 RepID=A0A1B8U2G3_9FLAO|nr:Crp/Fnr family transcriptional regulator [Polaribacter reichenbachii]APZ47371.1 cyclic nucleotide-binding protein [Polaribacter reichenbachii]AUC18012.1 cyclic nucleotide-binding protein [Polaribacter reichenbachii]OBY66058.1 cyclic nucleotide-binding protein [Polaribacter reichenbachii]
MTKEKYISELKLKFESYAPISDQSWALIESILTFQKLEKDEILLRNGQIAKNIHFICEGALRAFVTDYDGNIYNKNIFLETDFAGSTVSYLLNSPSSFTLEALEETILINLNYKKYRQLIEQNIDLKNFYIAYLENNWVIEKEQREVSLVMENATERYLKLLKKHPNIDQRIQKLHIASHLGITPTQLSRIRKTLK